MLKFKAIFLACFFSSAAYAQASLPCSPEQINQFNSVLSGQLPGNASSSNTTRCEFLVRDEGIAIVYDARLHIKDRICNNRPWGGQWCVDKYNVWANAGIILLVEEDCKVTTTKSTIDVTSGSTDIFAPWTFLASMLGVIITGDVNAAGDVSKNLVSLFATAGLSAAMSDTSKTASIVRACQQK